MNFGAERQAGSFVNQVRGFDSRQLHLYESAIWLQLCTILLNFRASSTQALAYAGAFSFGKRAACKFLPDDQRLR